MEKDLPLKLDRETLLQLAPEQLVDIIAGQAIAIDKLNKRILELEQEVEKLKVRRASTWARSRNPATRLFRMGK